MTVIERRISVGRVPDLQEKVLALLSQGVGTIVGSPRHGAHGAYYQSVSPYLTLALEEIDVGLDLDCSHLFVRDIHDPEKLLVSTSSAKSTVFCRERFLVDSAFLRELVDDKEEYELPVDRRLYSPDRLWELLWETMTVGPYARPWSLVGFALWPPSADGPDPRPEPAGFLIFVGRQGWFSAHMKECRACFSMVVPLFALTAQVIRAVSRLATLSDWASPELTAEMATAGKLHGVLTPLQRLELKLGIAEELVKRTRPHRDILSGFDAIRTELFEARRCVKDFLDTRALTTHLHERVHIPPEEYANPKEILSTVIEQLQQLALQRGKAFVVRANDAPPLAISATDFELIVANLLHNAVKYGDPGTKIKVACEEAGGKGVLDVTSYGICIPPMERERIFEPGYRTAEASRIEYTAAGLGLFTARRAAERWGGHLFLQKSEKETFVPGFERYRTVFRLELPL